MNRVRSFVVLAVVVALLAAVVPSSTVAAGTNARLATRLAQRVASRNAAPEVPVSDEPVRVTPKPTASPAPATPSTPAPSPSPVPTPSAPTKTKGGQQQQQTSQQQTSQQQTPQQQTPQQQTPQQQATQQQATQQQQQQQQQAGGAAAPAAPAANNTAPAPAPVANGTRKVIEDEPSASSSVPPKRVEANETTEEVPATPLSPMVPLLATRRVPPTPLVPDAVAARKLAAEAAAAAAKNASETAAAAAAALPRPNGGPLGKLGDNRLGRIGLDDGVLRTNRGPVGRIPDPTLEAVFVPQLNTAGSPIGRLSARAAAESQQKKLRENNRRHMEGARHEDEEYIYPLEDSRGPVGRLPKVLPPPSTGEIREPGATETDLKPSANVQWVHLEKLMADAKRDYEAHAPRDSEGRIIPSDYKIHVNDADFNSIAYKEETKVLKPYRDGPEFTLNNALNHPEKIMATISHDIDRELEKQLVRYNDTTGYNATLERRAMRERQPEVLTEGNVEVVEPGVAAGQFRPLIVEGQLPDSKRELLAEVASPISGAEKIEDGFANWEQDLVVRASPRVIDSDPRVVHSLSVPAAADPGGVEQSTTLSGEMQRLAERQAEVLRDIIDTKQRLGTVDMRQLHERIDTGYVDHTDPDTVLPRPSITLDPPSPREVREKSLPQMLADQERLKNELANQMDLLAKRQLDLVNRVHATKAQMHRAEMKVIRHRLENGY